MHTSEYDYLFKLLLIGDSGVGKVNKMSCENAIRWFSNHKHLYSLACFCGLRTTPIQRAILAPLELTSRYGPLNWKGRLWSSKSSVLWLFLFAWACDSFYERGILERVFVIYIFSIILLLATLLTHGVSSFSGTPQVSRHVDSKYRLFKSLHTSFFRTGTFPHHYFFVLPWCSRYHCRLRRYW